VLWEGAAVWLELGAVLLESSSSVSVSLSFSVEIM